MKPLLDEPVPSELKAAIETMIQRKMSEELTQQTAILPFPKRPAHLPALRQWMMPIAASLVVAALNGLAGYWLATDGGRSDGLQIVGIDRRSLSEALTTHPSGEKRNSLHPVSAFVLSRRSAMQHRRYAANSRWTHRMLPVVPDPNGR